MMTRLVTKIDLIVGSNTVNVSAIQALADMSIMRHYELRDTDITQVALDKELDTWAELEVCECLDLQFPLVDPLTESSVVTTYVGQA